MTSMCILTCLVIHVIFLDPSSCIDHHTTHQIKEIKEAWFLQEKMIIHAKVFVTYITAFRLLPHSFWKFCSWGFDTDLHACQSWRFDTDLVVCQSWITWIDTKVWKCWYILYLNLSRVSVVLIQSNMKEIFKSLVVLIQSNLKKINLPCIILQWSLTLEFLSMFPTSKYLQLSPLFFFFFLKTREALSFWPLNATKFSKWTVFIFSFPPLPQSSPFSCLF